MTIESQNIIKRMKRIISIKSNDILNCIRNFFFFFLKAEAKMNSLFILSEINSLSFLNEINSLSFLSEINSLSFLSEN
jgi:hypothetical protein